MVRINFKGNSLLESVEAALNEVNNNIRIASPFNKYYRVCTAEEIAELEGVSVEEFEKEEENMVIYEVVPVQGYAIAKEQYIDQISDASGLIYCYIGPEGKLYYTVHDRAYELELSDLGVDLEESKDGPSKSSKKVAEEDSFIFQDYKAQVLAGFAEWLKGYVEPSRVTADIIEEYIDCSLNCEGDAPEEDLKIAREVLTDAYLKVEVLESEQKPSREAAIEYLMNEFKGLSREQVEKHVDGLEKLIKDQQRRTNAEQNKEELEKQYKRLHGDDWSHWEEFTASKINEASELQTYRYDYAPGDYQEEDYGLPHYYDDGQEDEPEYIPIVVKQVEASSTEEAITKIIEILYDVTDEEVDRGFMENLDGFLYSYGDGGADLIYGIKNETTGEIIYEITDGYFNTPDVDNQGEAVYVRPDKNGSYSHALEHSAKMNEAENTSSVYLDLNDIVSYAEKYISNELKANGGSEVKIFKAQDGQYMITLNKDDNSIKAYCSLGEAE